MPDAGSLLTIAFGFLVVWGIVVLIHGILASLSPRGNPLPPEPPHHQGEDH